MAIPTADTGLVALAVGAVIVLVRIVERLVFDRNKNGNGKCALTAELSQKLSNDHRDQASQLERLNEWHDRADGDGTPLGFVPRSWGSKLDSLNSSVRDLHEVGRKTCAVQEEILEEMKASRRSQ